jgi:hypothetical protein
MMFQLFTGIHPSGPRRGGQVRRCKSALRRQALKESNSRSTEAVLGRGPLVLGSVLLDTSVLRGLVVLTTGVGLTALGTLDMGVGSVTNRQSSS